MHEHDYQKYPELTNQQIEMYGFTSPHKQYTEDFHAKVVKVVDGDTIHLSTDERDFVFPLRLLDINAPEMYEGGHEAKEWLQNLVEGQEVTVLIDRSKRVGRYGRLLGKVLYGGLDVGMEMLNFGLAVVFGSDVGQIKNLNKELRSEQWY